MRWMRFEVDGNISYGIVEGDAIKAVDGNPFEGYSETGMRHDISDVTLLIPVVPKTFYAAGLNYVTHVEVQARLHGREINLPKKATSATGRTTH